MITEGDRHDSETIADTAPCEDDAKVVDADKSQSPSCAEDRSTGTRGALLREQKR
jgi:hypothetical protein